MDKTLTCKHCGSIRKSIKSLIAHECTCPKNPTRPIRINGMKGKKGKNQYIKAKELGLPPPTLSEEARKIMSAKAILRNKKIVWDDARRLVYSEMAKKNGLGGHNSKIRLNYTRKDGTIVHLQSSYEVRFATILDELGIEWDRPEPLLYEGVDNKIHRYYPDFRIGNRYFDTKNDYLCIVDAPKIKMVSEQNDVVIIIVTKDQLNLESVIQLCKH